MRIVIVEDEVKIREGMGKLIASCTGHMIVGEAQDGEEGLEMILRFKPDLVIMDIQMPKMNGLEVLKELHEKKIPVHIVILSGYSEFEYARTAIQYGVDDYLLKPIGAEDVQSMLINIDAKIKKDALLYGTPEIYFRNFLTGNEEMREQSMELLGQTCGMTLGHKLELFIAYIGAAQAAYKREMEKAVHELKEKYDQLHIFYVYLENTQKAYIMAIKSSQGIQTLEQLERSIYHRMLANYCNQEERPIWTKYKYERSEDTWQVVEKLHQYISYALVLTTDTWLDEDVIAQYKQQILEQPAEIYHHIRSAVCTGDELQIRKASEEFLQFMKSGAFGVEDTRRAFIKSYYLMADTLQEIDNRRLTSFKNTNAMRNMEFAVTWHELETAYKDMIQVLCSSRMKREDISNYVIQKAINYIREHYQEGITQEEVSRELNITPEYLSTLFNREMGIKFSVFLKQFRISHAKRLLQGTDKKIYEIALEVGYSDAKYFQRVFKEEIGVSPGDYRLMNGI